MPTTDKGILGRIGSRRWRPWRNVLLALVALSVYQYASDGSISWPGAVVDKVGGSLRDYANRPNASWREATDKLEELGAAREGNPVPEFGITGRVVRVADGRCACTECGALLELFYEEIDPPSTAPATDS